jgi:hypothetical protein
MNSNFPLISPYDSSFTTAFPQTINGQSDITRLLIGEANPFLVPPPGATVFEEYPFGGVPGTIIEAEAGTETVLVPLEIEGLGTTLALESVAAEGLLALGPVGGAVLVTGMLTYGLYKIYTDMRESAQQSGSTTFIQAEQDRMFGLIGQVNVAENEIRSLLSAGRPSNPDEAARWDRQMAVAVETLGTATGELVEIIQANSEHVSPFIVERVEEIHRDFIGTLDFRPDGAGTPTIDQIMTAVNIEGRVEEDLLNSGFPSTVNILPSIGADGELVFSADVHLGSNNLTSLIASSVAIIAAGAIDEMASDLGVGPYGIDPSVTVTDHDGTSIEVPLLVGTPDAPETSPPTTSNLSPAAQEILTALNNPNSGVYSVDLSGLQLVNGRLLGSAFVNFGTSGIEGMPAPDGNGLQPGGITGHLEVMFDGSGEPFVKIVVNTIAALPADGQGDGLRGADLMAAVFPAAVTALTDKLKTDQDSRASESIIDAVSNSVDTGPNAIGFTAVINGATHLDIARFREAFAMLVENRQPLTLNNFVAAFNGINGSGISHDELIAKLDSSWGSYEATFGGDEDVIRLGELLYRGVFGLEDDISVLDSLPSGRFGNSLDPSDATHLERIEQFMFSRLTQTSGSLGRMATGYMEREFGVLATDFSYVSSTVSEYGTLYFTFEPNSNQQS